MHLVEFSSKLMLRIDLHVFFVCIKLTVLAFTFKKWLKGTTHNDIKKSEFVPLLYGHIQLFFSL